MTALLFLLVFPITLAVAWLMYRRTNGNLAIPSLIAAVGLILGVANGCGYKQALHHSMKEKTLTVNHKERTGGKDSKWLVFTNHGVYSVEDSLWLWKFDASDRYNQIRVGHTYRCKAAGWRIHFTSDYQNLVSCREKASA